MRVSQAVGRALVELGVDHVFGVVGSGNFHVTNAMVAAGARFVAARHEGGAATMADAYARTAGAPAALTVHQGCGLTNAMTGIAEAAKSRTPLVVLAAEATSPASNFAVDQDALAAGRRRRPRPGHLAGAGGRGDGRRPSRRRCTSAAPCCSTCRSTCRTCPPRRRGPVRLPAPPIPAEPAAAELARLVEVAARRPGGRCSSPAAARGPPTPGPP